MILLIIIIIIILIFIIINNNLPLGHHHVTAYSHTELDRTFSTYKYSRELAANDMHDMTLSGKYRRIF